MVIIIMIIIIIIIMIIVIVIILIIIIMMDCQLLSQYVFTVTLKAADFRSTAGRRFDRI